jgi:hypothetical protein
VTESNFNVHRFPLFSTPIAKLLMASAVPSPSDLDRSHQSFFTTGMAVIWAIAMTNLLLHIYINNRYGYFRDEFDYMSCGDHLAWGYVDQPPLIPVLVHFCRIVLGDSLRSICFIPALASSLLIVQTAAIARELGGRRYALLLSAICVLIALQYLPTAACSARIVLNPTSGRAAPTSPSSPSSVEGKHISDFMGKRRGERHRTTDLPSVHMNGLLLCSRSKVLGDQRTRFRPHVNYGAASQLRLKPDQ